ncbi:hypothetical protein T265_08483 [Opisthorchis viverrini]|uniref:Torsin-1A C-terminal domain-containing protein n=1 Tax=Opisthorchis viverrini TaxID=6198 RepID=A0A074ZK10_OPIVI|nr:hypothetical protein T265_08483 [Opisthorchis viverrini]KER23670.1 hypothetical protein T265_08483 [Opisthorchis viverrini]
MPSTTFLLLVLLSFVTNISAFPFVALVPVSGLLAAFLARDGIECLLRECCSQGVWFNQTGLKHVLTHHLHGQHIVTERVFHHLSAHMLDRNPPKALALSFHGYTGVGKNFVSNLIASHVFKRGTKSRFFHFYDSTIHFAHRQKVHEYKVRLHKELREAVSACPYSVFVFDEMHNMPSGLLDVLAPLLDFHESIDGVDFRRSIFLFLSNAGGNSINRRLYDHLKDGKKREDLLYTDMDRIITKSAFNDDGGLRYSELIQKHLITAMVPFLPLQAEHVRLCIRDVTVQRQVPLTDNLVNFVLDELEWSPENTQLFSVSGCKRVYEKVAFYLQQT